MSSTPRTVRLTTRFLIASPTPQAPAPSALRAFFQELTPDPDLRLRAERFLEAEDLPLLGPPLSAPSPWTSRLRGCAGTAALVAEVLDAPFHRLVEARPNRASLPGNLQAARLFARAVAAATHGVLVDLDSGQVLAAEPEASAFFLADGWVGVFISPDGDGLIRADSAGLHRFGLPEISARGVPLGHIHLAANLIRGLAYRLATVHHPALGTSDDHPPTSSATATLTRCTTTDVMHFWGLVASSGPSVTVRLVPSASLCPDCETGLEAVPPTPTPVSEWWQTHASALPPQPRPVPPRQAVPALDMPRSSRPDQPAALASRAHCRVWGGKGVAVSWSDLPPSDLGVGGGDRWGVTRTTRDHCGHHADGGGPADEAVARVLAARSSHGPGGRRRSGPMRDEQGRKPVAAGWGR